MTIRMVPLLPGCGRDIYDMLQEIPRDENGFMNGVNGMSYEEYEAWLVKSEASARQKGILDGWKVPQSGWALYVDGVPVGIGKTRHFLTDKLREEGGHIGYAIRPSQRNKGYGALLLKQLLQEAKKLGIDRALITVRNGNEASLRVALKNGGVVEREENGRYYIWIDARSG